MKAIKIFATLFVAVALFVACEPNTPNTPNTPDTPNTEVTDSTTTQEPEAVAITVKAKVPAAWTEKITVWVWPTGGDGAEADAVKEGDWYVYTAAEGVTELNIIFKNGEGWTGDANQTVDITVSENTCMEIESDGATKATFVNVDCE